MLSTLTSCILALLGIMPMNVLIVYYVMKRRSGNGKVMDAHTDGMIVLDVKNRVRAMNLKAKQIFEPAVTQKIGCNVREFFHERPDLVKFIMEGGEYIESEYSINHRNRTCETLCLPLKDARGHVVGKLLIFHDVTEQRLTEVTLLEKQRQIAVAEERERMARDLHDNFGQILAFVSVQAQAIRAYLEQNQLPTAISCFERLTEVAQEAHTAVRESIQRMHGQRGDREMGMAEFLIALDGQAELFKRSFGITVEIDYSEVESLELFDSKTAEQVLNIIKESLNNIIKHSAASCVKIKFEEGIDELMICVSDNGCGFDVKSTAAGNLNNFGLLFMQERAAEIGSHLEIHSEVGKGTTVKVQVPRVLPKGNLCQVSLSTN